MSRRRRGRRRGYQWPLRQFVIMDARAFDSDPERADRATVLEVCSSIVEAAHRAPEHGDGNAIVVCIRTDEVQDGAPVYAPEATLTITEARTWRAPT